MYVLEKIIYLEYHVQLAGTCEYVAEKFTGASLVASMSSENIGMTISTSIDGTGKKELRDKFLQELKSATQGS